MQISSSLLTNVGVRQTDAERYVDALNIQLPKYRIDTPLRVAHFLAQVLHESAKMRAVEENLNYSATGLRQTFRKYFPTLAEAEDFARQPERIANRVYANRLGNGPELSGDGYRYRGRGLIQLTGKDNYRRFVDWLGEDVIANPELVAQHYAVHSAVYFWDWRGLNQTADTDDVRTITLRINGGLTGLAEREKLLQKLKQQLADLEAQEDREEQGNREPGSPITVPVTERKIPAYVVAATSLNLRSQPAIRSDTVITRLPADTAVAKLEQAADPGWWKIQTEIAGRLLEGYVAAEYLAPRKLPPDHSVAVMLLNLRSRPEVAANTRLALMAQGTPVARLEPAADPEWWKIQVELHGALLEGYVAYRYLTPIKKAPTHRVVATLLNLRSKPVIAADTLLTRLPQNLPVAVLTAADQAGWLKIQVELEEQLLEGYVADEYLAALGK